MQWKRQHRKKKCADDLAAEIMELKAALQAAHDRETALKLTCENVKMRAVKKATMVLELKSDLKSVRNSERLLKASCAENDKRAKNQAARIRELVASLRAARESSSAFENAYKIEKARVAKDAIKID
ncbi:hypothetical protein IW150_000763 [Coemansia sp. RSA 2607]|nr:hypothetical protein IW150_000763 [Coemansia sp. RSA 2607]